MRGRSLLRIQGSPIAHNQLPVYASVVLSMHLCAWV